MPAATSAVDKDSASDGYETNNNLVEISDWLTKIVVGLGLINLKDLPHFLRRASAPLQPCLGDCYLPFGVALILGFSTLGFLFGNVFTRLFLARAIALADPGRERLRKSEEEQARDTEEIVKNTRTKTAGGVVNPAVAMAPDEWKTKFRALAEEYQSDNMKDYRERLNHKNDRADRIGEILLTAKASKTEVADFVAANPRDGFIAGFATYCITKPEKDDVSLLLRVAALAGRLHTNYRLVLAFRRLLRNHFGSRSEIEQIRVLITGWMESADDPLKVAIQRLVELMEQELHNRE